MDRLPPVLHAVPLSPDAAGQRGDRLPAAAAGQPRRRLADAGGGHVERPAGRRAQARQAPREAGAPLRRLLAARGQEGPQERGLQSRADQGQRQGPAQADRRDELGARGLGVVGLRRDLHVQRRGVAREGGVRARGRGRPAPHAGLGHRRQRRALLTHRGRARRLHGGHRHRPPDRRPPAPRAARGGPRRRAHPGDEPRRSLPRSRLARARAQAAGGARAARPRAVSRPRAPPRHNGQRAAVGGRGLAGLAGRDGGRRVPDPRGPDGAAPARGQARGDPRRLRAAGVRAHPRRGVRDRATSRAAGRPAGDLPGASRGGNGTGP